MSALPTVHWHWFREGCCARGTGQQVSSEARDADFDAHLPKHDKNRKNLTLSFPLKSQPFSNEETCTVVRGRLCTLPLWQKYINLPVMMNPSYETGQNPMAEVTCWVYSLSDRICSGCHTTKNLGTNFRIPLLPGRKRKKRKKEKLPLQPFPWGHPEYDPLLRLNSIFDLPNERKRNQC